MTVFDVDTHWVDVGGKGVGCDDGCGGGRGGTDMTAMVLLLSPSARGTSAGGTKGGGIDGDESNTCSFVPPPNSSF